MMNCEDLRDDLITHAAGEALEPEADARLQQHLKQCAGCRQRFEWERQVQDALEAQEVPEPSRDFEARVLAAATGADRRGGGGHWKRNSFIGGAVAAALAVGVFVGSGMESSPERSSEPVMAETVEPVQAWEREETVRLAFNSRSELEDVTLTIELPPHVEVSRFPGHSQLSWKVDLEPGDNVISLPLRIAFPEEGELVAHLGEGPDRRTFVAPIPGLSEKDQEPEI